MRRIGPYAIEEQLGRGGMGAVYLARDPQGQPVALKLLRVDAAVSTRQRERFAREAEALRQVQHEHVVRLRDLGEERGVPYLVLDYHREGTLADLLERGPLDPRVAARLGVQLASALEAAHGVGVLHRDLKPSNVLIDPRGAALLTDFGLARMLEQSESERLTQTGALVGSPGYWSPEQAAGERDEVGVGTDVYGLGAVLYAALSGGPPFRGASLLENVTLTARAAPEPLGARVPAPLSAIVLRCLEKDPAARFPDAASLRAALEAVLAEPTSADRPRSRAPALALVALGALGLLAALGLAGERLAAGSAPLARSPLPTPTAASPSPSPALQQRPDPRFAAQIADCQALAQQGRHAEARALMQVIADQGSIEACYSFANACREGRGGPRDLPLSTRYYRRAAEAGHHEAENKLGFAYYSGQGIERDLAQAVRWYRRAAEGGEVGGMFNLGVVLAKGAGTPQNVSEAAAWYRRAAELGSAPAMHNLAVLYWSGQGELLIDRPRAIEWHRRAAEAGHSGSMLVLGELSAKGEEGYPVDHGTALGWYRRGAERGDARCIQRLGEAYEDGLGVAVDLPRARELYQRAAERGNALAMLLLGHLCRTGRGGPRQPALAARWYRAAMEEGNELASYYYAVSLAQGRGVPRDRAEAIRLLRRTAQRGYARGMVTLGMLLARGTPAERAEARALFERAILSDDPPSRQRARQELEQLDAR